MPATPLPPASGPLYAPPSNIPVVTTPYLSGYRVVRTIGATFGLIVRSRGVGGNIMAGFRSLAGGEIKEYTQLLEQARHEAMMRLAQHAQSLGANAVLSVGFDTSEMSEVMTEIMAYGTAVIVEPDSTPAQAVSLR